jgi:hypothetical protein
MAVVFSPTPSPIVLATTTTTTTTSTTSTTALLSSSPPLRPPPPLCKHWARSRQCLYHDKGLCKFHHPPDNNDKANDNDNDNDNEQWKVTLLNGGGDDDCGSSSGGTYSGVNRSTRRKQAQAQAQRQRQCRSLLDETTDGCQGCPCRSSNRCHHHHRRHRRPTSHKDTRVAKFRAFLIQSLPGGLSTLSQHHVLDVAGGKGELAFQLLHLCHVQSCHVVDPRQSLQLTRFQHRFQRGFYHRSALALHADTMMMIPVNFIEENDENDNDNEDNNTVEKQQHQHQQHPMEIRPVGHLRCFFTKELWQSSSRDGHDDDDDDDEDEDEAIVNKKKKDKFQSNCKAAETWTWPPKGEKKRNNNEHTQQQKQQVKQEENHRQDKEDEEEDDDKQEACICHSSSRGGSNNNCQWKMAQSTNGHDDDGGNNDDDEDHDNEEMEEEDDDDDDDNNDTNQDTQNKNSIPTTTKSKSAIAATKAATTTTPLPTWEYASAITQQCSLIVGMHPDQAVDAIVDAALALQISFFVIPCCIYSAEFPHRRTPSGSPVKNYDDLLDYLQAKSPHTIQRATLPFDGKNICLYQIVV